MSNFSFCNTKLKLICKNKVMQEMLNDRIGRYFFRIDDDSSLDYTVEICVNDVLYQCVSSALDAHNYSLTVISYCTTEKGTVRARKYRINDNIVIATTTNDAIWIIDQAKPFILFLGKESVIDSFHKSFYVFFEHIIIKKCVQKGAVLLHAAAAMDLKGVVLYIGEKRAGKTTLLFESCGRHMMQPVSVDKVLVCLEDNNLIVYGVPTRLRVLAGTLSKYPELHHLIPEKYTHSTNAELWRGASDGKVEMQITEFESFSNAQFKPWGNLSKIIACSIKMDNKCLLIKGVHKHVLSAFEKSIYSPDNPEEDWWSEIGYESQNMEKYNAETIREYVKSKVELLSFYGSEDLTILFE